MVVAQLAERLLSIPELGGLIPIIGKILKLTNLLLTVEKDKNKTKRQGMDHLF